MKEKEQSVAIEEIIDASKIKLVSKYFLFLQYYKSVR